MKSCSTRLSGRATLPYIAGEEKNWPFEAEYIEVLIMLTQSAGERLKTDAKFSGFSEIIEKCR